jgi:uncharacterized protein (TIGR02996 family)
MTNDEAFLRAIIDNPGDDTPRLIYADYLEERGDPRAAAIRAYPDIGRLVASLQTATQAPQDEIERHAAAGRIDLLAALALVLEGCRNLTRNRKWPGIVPATLDHLERVLAVTPGTAAVEVLLARPRSPAQDRTFASLLAGCQPREVLLPLFERHALEDRHAELLACLAQEMVLRGAELVGVPTVSCFQEKLRVQNHPLARLPLPLLDLEEELHLWLPQYGPRSSGWGTAFETRRGPPAPLPPGPGRTPVVVREVTEPAAAGRIAAAVTNWQVESRVFHPEAPLGRDEVSVGLVLSLGLECLRGAAAEDIRTGLIPPGQALNVLFSAASTGGAYNRGLAGAYGRLAAWRSLAGLAGASADATVEEVAGLARRCTWASFDASSEWFFNVAWDVGLLAVRPDGQSLAVLAATDTD